MFDLQVPFFNPLWRRVLVTAACIGWALFEAVSGSISWAVLFGAAGLWCAYELFVVWKPAEDQQRPREED